MTLPVRRFPISLDPLIREAKRRTRLRRSLLALVLLLLAGVAVDLVFLRTSPGPGVLRPPGGTAHAGKLSVSIPHGFYVYPSVGPPSYPGPRNPVEGRTLSDYPFRPHGWFWFPGRGSHRAPSNGVALELDHLWWATGPASEPPAHLHLPLSVKQPWFPEHRSSDYHRGVFRFDGGVYSVMYWIGPTASASDRAAILRALRSIRPTR